MRQSSMDKMNAVDLNDMLYLENIMKHLRMEIANGFMDNLAEIHSRAKMLNGEEARSFFNASMRIVSELAVNQLTEEIMKEYRWYTSAEEEPLREWAGKVARYYVYGMNDVPPASNKLDSTVVERVYEGVTKYLGLED